MALKYLSFKKKIFFYYEESWLYMKTIYVLSQTHTYLPYSGSY